MNVFKHCIIFCALVAAASLMPLEKVVAQTQEELKLQSIQVSYKTTAGGRAYVFMTEAPSYAKTWKLSVTEHNGIRLFSDTGQNWNDAGYEWIPKAEITLHSAIFYIVTISFVSEDNQVLSTKSSKFFIKQEVINNRTPLIFFRGNTVIYSSSLYNENTGGVEGLLDFIVAEANNEYKERSILVRGHAAFVTRTVEERQKEQIELLALSNDRALQVIQELAKRNVNSERIIYEVLGGSEELSKDPRQLWKNRRVEIIFMPKERNAYMKEKNETVYKQLPTTPSTTTTATQKPRLIPPTTTPTEETTDSTSNTNVTNTTNITQTERDTITKSEIENPASTPMVEKQLTEQQVEPWPDTPIMSKGVLTANELAAFVLYKIPALNTEYVRRIASSYVLEAAREGVHHDIAFAQMLLETDYLQFTGTLHKNQYNFAGIGSVDNRKEGNWFATETIGIRAHIQHLKGYASKAPLRGNLVDPRYPVLEYSGLLGSAPLVSSLSGRWSEETEYGTKILRMLRLMYNFADAWREATTQ